MHNTLKIAAKGSWQKEVLEDLMRDGYIVGYLATGLNGKATSSSTRYAKSLSNLMYRIENILKEETSYKLERGNIGIQGTLGYYITT